MKKPNRVLEQAQASDGTKYRIYDDGNCHTFHLFTVERLHLYGKHKAWERVNTEIYTDWREAHKCFESFVGKTT